MKSDLVDVTVQVHALTDRAIRVSDDGDIVTMPEWLALKEGLI